MVRSGTRAKLGLKVRNADSVASGVQPSQQRPAISDSVTSEAEGRMAVEREDTLLVSVPHTSNAVQMCLHRAKGRHMGFVYQLNLG